MKPKYVLTLLATIILGTTGSALAQQSSTPEASDLQDEPLSQVFSLVGDGGGYLGVYAENISRENMGKYNLSQPRGVAVTQVIKDSPAEKAGLRKDDVILRVDGENVTSVRKLNRLVSEIAPDQSVRITVSRSGSEQELSATISKRPNMTNVQNLLNDANGKLWNWDRFGTNKDGDLVFTLGNTRRVGISTMELTRQLADYFGVTNGVLITSVTEDGPAAKAGVRAGDVVTAIDGEKVDSTGDISRIINNKKEGDVTLTVIRNKTQQTIRVTPRQSSTFPAATIGRPQVGRTIVIPRVEFPAIPEVNVSIPQVVIPAIPSINIQMPTIRVTPRAKVVRTVSRPI
jgi:membrane-associated protease RseP (regulator of RpoE activity)